MSENKGHKNLVPQNQRTKAEQRRIASEGGKASGEARRQRKALKDLMEIILQCEPDKRTVNKMLRMGLDSEDLIVAAALDIALVQEGLKGNVSAFKEIRDLIGEAGDQTDANALAKARELLGGVKSAF
ncbi:hypothetical protein LJC60_01055 [Ruminococcaceae bacterium OttesenSCG-928-D13]|nr:hypothetical protein [Ruminococcaceae bacterium OttesenSCG-928-D13]